MANALNPMNWFRRNQMEDMMSQMNDQHNGQVGESGNFRIPDRYDDEVQAGEQVQC